MGKPLINTKQWTRNDIRMLIISIFIFVYPVLTGSVFMVLLFFALPKERIQIVGWVRISAAHAYWLIASGAWVLLLSIILPLMRDKHEYQPNGPHGNKHGFTPAKSQKEPDNKAKDHGSTEKIPNVHYRVEDAKLDSINRDSILPNRASNTSDDTSSNSVEKGTLEEKADKETLEKLQRNVSNSKENIQKSLESINANDYTLKKRKSMMHSGEFLNDCIGNIEEDNKKQDDDDDDMLEDENKKQVQADVYIQNDSINDKEKDSTEKENKDDDSDIEMINETQDMNGKIEEDKSDESKPDKEEDNKSDSEGSQNNESSIDDIESQIHSTEVVTPAPLNVVDKELCQEAIIDDDDEEEEEEELGELVEHPSLAQRRNIENPSVDTSLANASFTESIVTTPISAASLNRRNSNVVHLFVQGNT